MMGGLTRCGEGVAKEMKSKRQAISPHPSFLSAPLSSHRREKADERSPYPTGGAPDDIR